jgi:DDE family transposase
VILYPPLLIDSEKIDDGGFQFGELRRSAPAKKGCQVLERMCSRMHVSLRQIARNRAENVGITRFFCNPSVTPKEMLETAAARTDAAAAGRHVLLIQDTSEINYQAKSGRKRELGKVGNGEDLGLFVHPALAVDADDGTVLGLAGATIWRRVKAKAENYQELPIEEKESHRWLSTPSAARALLSSAALVTIIADREADIYELFARLPDARTHLLIRAEHDRALGERGGRLFAAIAERPEAGRLEFELEGRPGRSARKVTLAVRFRPVTLRQPRRGADPRDPRRVTLNMVEVKEIDAPAGEDPIHWRLLTTHAVASVADAARMVELYRLRWNIEQLFRTLKSQGLQIEESFAEDGDALERLAAVALIAACMVMQLVRGRGPEGEAQSASLLFTPSEIKVLKVIVADRQGKTAKQKNPYRPGSLAWAAWAIARLGGWTGYASERPPGPITFTRGLRQFHAMAQGYQLATSRYH